MKYYIPDLHSISAASATAHCVDGSGADNKHSCYDGGQVDIPGCYPGSVAQGPCNTGTTAESCGLGDAIDAACNTGYSASPPCTNGVGVN